MIFSKTIKYIRATDKIALHAPRNKRYRYIFRYFFIFAFTIYAKHGHVKQCDAFISNLNLTHAGHN